MSEIYGEKSKNKILRDAKRMERDHLNHLGFLPGPDKLEEPNDEDGEYEDEEVIDV